MGQQANSGRNASLDDKKARAAGRQQNDPAREAIIDRPDEAPVPGASGKDGRANVEGGTGGFAVTGDQSGNSGGEAAMDVDRRVKKSGS